jgi:hypothetical protein
MPDLLIVFFCLCVGVTVFFAAHVLADFLSRLLTRWIAE